MVSCSCSELALCKIKKIMQKIVMFYPKVEPALQTIQQSILTTPLLTIS